MMGKRQIRTCEAMIYHTETPGYRGCAAWFQGTELLSAISLSSGPKVNALGSRIHDSEARQDVRPTMLGVGLRLSKLVVGGKKRRHCTAKSCAAPEKEFDRYCRKICMLCSDDLGP